MNDAPLLLIHGYPFDHTMWFPTIASIGAHARVIAPDLPGFGTTPLLRDRPPSLEAFADYLADILDQAGHPRAVIAGMSMGGYVALAFAEKYPRRVLGLGLVSSQAAADSPEGRQARFDTIQRIRAQGPGVAVDALLPKLYSDRTSHLPDLQQYPRKGAQDAGVAGLCWALEAMARRPDRTALFQSLELPVLVVHGSDDKIIPIAKARQLAERCRQPILVELPGVGHGSPLEAPDKVAAALVGLVQSSVHD